MRARGGGSASDIPSCSCDASHRFASWTGPMSMDFCENFATRYGSRAVEAAIQAGLSFHVRESGSYDSKPEHLYVELL